MSDHYDFAVVGAGIIGLAVARELHLRRPDSRIVVLEREGEIATHQTSHNSGVIHAGVYYSPGSLKARLCVEGARRMYEFCAEHRIPARPVGKLIIATQPAELPALEELERRALVNGVGGLRRLRGEEIAEVEPQARGLAALHSPRSGIVDFLAVARALAGELSAAGAELLPLFDVARLEVSRGGLRLRDHGGREVQAGLAIACAGLWSDRLARLARAPKDPRIVPFRGGYLRLRPERRHLVRGLIYPVPDPSLPFLGIHLTRTVTGEVLAGPTAMLAPSRIAYSLSELSAHDAVQTLGWPGTWRMGARWWRTGLRELSYAVRPARLAAAAARYVPALEPADFEPAWAGVRAQAVARDGTLVDDFVLHRTERMLHVRNAPSPAATAAFALATLIVDQLP